jgi:uncharacterized SAM-binding protein YcdF (DUF218 family)
MLGQTLTVLISPLGTVILLGMLALGLAGCIRGKSADRIAWGIGLAALIWLCIWSTPLASDALRAEVEGNTGPRHLSEIPVNRVAVVLGGGVSGPRPPERPDPDLGAAADRVWHAARIYHAGKVKQLLLSGGTVRTGDGSEAEAMRQFLLDLGVQDSAIWLEQDSQNTTANAQRTAQWLQQQHIFRITLVTSALHMPRARAAFERAGLVVDPAPTDFEVIPMPIDLQRLLPDTSALNGSARAMKEIVGQWLGR